MSAEKLCKCLKLRAAVTGVKQSLADVDTSEGKNIFAITSITLRVAMPASYRRAGLI